LKRGGEMEVSEVKLEPSGKTLIQTVVELTELPQSWVYSELDQILERSGQSANQITLDQLREALMAYLEDLKTDLISDESTTESGL